MSVCYWLSFWKYFSLFHLTHLNEAHSQLFGYTNWNFLSFLPWEHKRIEPLTKIRWNLQPFITLYKATILYCTCMITMHDKWNAESDKSLQNVQVYIYVTTLQTISMISIWLNYVLLQFYVKHRGALLSSPLNSKIW